MPDTFSTAKRSQIMAAVRSRGNKATELSLIRIFRENRVSGWRRNVQIHGKPDFVFRDQKVAVFVDGCFWHGCRAHLRMPASNNRYWSQKIRRNIARDSAITKQLKESGWHVLRLWEHDLKRPSTVVKRVLRLLRNTNTIDRYGSVPN